MTTITQLDDSTSFETIIAATQQLLDRIDTQEIDPAQIQSEIEHLLSLDKGPRGFFASFLTDSRPFADQPSTAILAAFRAVPTVTADLLVKNLAMSTAMVVHHERNDDQDAKTSSAQVQRRSQHLIEQLDLPDITHELNALQESLSESGSYSAFLKRWNYDSGQRVAIAQVVCDILEKH